MQKYLYLNHRKRLLVQRYTQYEKKFDEKADPQEGIAFIIATLLVSVIAPAYLNDYSFSDLFTLTTVEWITIIGSFGLVGSFLLYFAIFVTPFFSLQLIWIELIEDSGIVAGVNPEKDIITTVDDFLLELGFGREEILDITQYENMFNEQTGLGIVNSLIRDLNARITKFLYIANWFGWETLELLKERNATRNYRLARNFILTIFLSCMIFLTSSNLLVELTGLLILLTLGMYFLIQLAWNLHICPDTAFNIPVEPMIIQSRN